MNHIIIGIKKSMVAFVLVCLPFIVSAVDPNFDVYVDNPQYISSNVFEFDVMIKASGSTSSFSLRTFQGGFWVNPAWVNSGTLTLQRVSGSSQLVSSGYNGALQWNANDKFINCAVNTGVRVGSTYLSTTVGTTPVRIIRIRATNTVSYPCGSTPDLKFNYVQNRSNLRLRSSVSFRPPSSNLNYDMFYPDRPFTGQAHFNGELWTSGDADGRSPVYAPANLPAGCSVSLHLTVYIQGYYLSGHMMQPVMFNQDITASASPMITDLMIVELHPLSDPTFVSASDTGELMTDGTLDCVFPSEISSSGETYYIVLKHRGCVETWSANPISFNSNVNYDFSTSISQAFGDNLIELETNVWGIYNSDLDQNGYITNIDYPAYDQDNSNQIGPAYVNTDMDGDGYVLNLDFTIFDLNNFGQVGKVTP